MTGRVVDAHLHLWDLLRSRYAWLTPELGPLYRDVGPDEAEAELRAAGVDAAILVQADDSASDTRFMLDVGRAHDWVAGVVGWVRLDHEPAAAAALEKLDGEPLLRGVRHLVHDDPRDDFLDLPQVRASLRRVAARGLTLDVPDAWPRHMAATARLAEDLPELTVVLDHLGKPPAAGDLGEWRAVFDRLAAAPNVVVKFSGLHLPGVPFTTDVVGQLLDVALDAFGSDRVLYGGDWPMSLPHGGYGPTWEVMRACLDRLTPGERDAILGGNAERVYGLAEARPGDAAAPGGPAANETPRKD